MVAPSDTRSRLIRTAEVLFAQHGIDTVSLREITRQSGARNAMAVQYHFRDRSGMLEAIVAKHSPSIEAGRQALLEQYQGDFADCLRPDGLSPPRRLEALRALASALVRPLAAKLSDRDGGAAFLQIHAQLVERTPRDPAVWSPTVSRWRDLADPLLERDAVRLHRRFTAVSHTATELGRRARSGPHRDERLFTSYLVDIVTAIVSSPVSEETRRLADERDRRRPPAT